MKLSNGDQTFEVDGQGRDSAGCAYYPCGAGCDHEEAPPGASIWHDQECTETLWEVR